MCHIHQRKQIPSCIPGTFIQVDISNNIHMPLQGTTAELIIKLDSSIYCKYLWYNYKGNHMIYLQLQQIMEKIY